MTDKSDLPPEAEQVLDDVDEKQKKERIADKLIKIAVERSYRDEDSKPQAGGFFHTPDAVAYVDIEIDGWRETWPVRSRGFRRWLVRVYYETTGTAPNSEALQTALGLCEARAHFDGPEREVYRRPLSVELERHPAPPPRNFPTARYEEPWGSRIATQI